MADAMPMVLLGGTVAMELAPRLEASGYATQPLLPLEETDRGEPTPAAVILSSGLEGHIPSLRRRWGSLPILLGSPQDDVESRCRALGGGADDLWLSSAGPSDLLTRLRLHLQLQPSTSESTCEKDLPLVVGNLEVHPLNHSVQRSGQPISLTSREFELLLLLMRLSPKVVSREIILKKIWPEERTTTSNVIEVYVRYLRRKLETGGQSRLIHTVRGLGYTLREER
jgi:two-component system response regulator MprA